MANAGKIFGRNLRSAREAAGYTQKQLGDAIAIGPGSVSQWERGSALPRADHLANICRLLNVSSDQLLGLPSTGFTITPGDEQWYLASPNQLKSYATVVQAGVTLFQQIVLAGQPENDVLRDEYLIQFGNAQLRRAVRLAFHAGAIKLQNVERNRPLERALLDKYDGKLRQCLVALYDASLPPIVGLAMRRELTAKLAATVAIKTVPGRGYAGVSGGTLMARFADHIPAGLPNLAGVTWIPLVSPRTVANIIPTESNTIASRLAYLHPNTAAFRLQYIPPHQRTREYYYQTAGTEREMLSEIRHVIDLARRCDTIFMSVGEARFEPHRLDAFAGLGMSEIKQLLLELSPTEQAECVGVVLLHLIDKQGEIWGGEQIYQAGQNLFLTLELDELRSIVEFGSSVWELLDRDEKVPAAHASIIGRLCNCIVLDTQTAQTLLDA